jgi:hypothetical protein
VRRFIGLKCEPACKLSDFLVSTRSPPVFLVPLWVICCVIGRSPWRSRCINVLVYQSAIIIVNYDMSMLALDTIETGCPLIFEIIEPGYRVLIDHRSKWDDAQGSILI